MPLQTSHRPQIIEDLYGNPHVKESLEAVLSRTKDKPHSFLITGASGCGKTTIGYIIKNMVECADSDFYYYNAANTRGIDTIREIAENSKYPPMFGKSKVYLLDECHMATKNASEAALLLLEDTQPFCYFVLCTTEPEQLKDTLKRRCHHYTVMPLKSTEMMELLEDTLSREKIKGYPKTILTQIIKISNGSPGKALKFLDMVIDITNDEYAMKLLSAEDAETQAIDLCRILVDFQNGAAYKWKEAQNVLRDLEADAESVRFQILGYMNKCMLGKGNTAQFAEIAANFIESFSYSGKAGLILATYSAIFLSGGSK